ncbi:putative porin [Acinetobacter sp. CAAS 2-6]|uniref:putative porin n=1 Tax=Acinetobacter sp. CAAS 2-6 TaxID=3016358 RepID=UPI002DD63A2A|nr:putative porin [Acinetobacter sp. CAAS 2-6]
MKKLSFLSLVLGATLGATQTQAYQYQIDAGYDHHEIDDIAGLTTNAGDFNLQATAYFENIKTKNVPVQEAAFLSQTSNIYGAYAYSFTDIEATDNSAELNIDGHDFKGGFEYLNRQNGLYVNAEIGRSNTDLSLSGMGLTSEDTIHTTHYRALFGFMPQNNLLIAAGVQGYNATGEQKEAGLAARAKYVTALGQKGQYLNLEANVNLNGMYKGIVPETDTYNAAADFYIDPTWSIGSSYTFVDYGPEDTDSISIRTKKYFNQQVALGAEVTFGENIPTTEDETIYGIRGTYRF